MRASVAQPGISLAYSIRPRGWGEESLVRIVSGLRRPRSVGTQRKRTGEAGTSAGATTGGPAQARCGRVPPGNVACDVGPRSHMVWGSWRAGEGQASP